MSPADASIALESRLAELLSRSPSAGRSTLLEAARTAHPLLDGADLHRVVDRAWDRAHALGPIDDLLDDDLVTEIMVNGAGVVWLDRDGALQQLGLVLTDDEVALLIDRILDPLGLRVDRVSPMVDARLADGSRVNIVVPPLAVDGPIITIRRFSIRHVPLEAFGPPAAVELLQDLVRQRRTIVVSGGTGAGKTTLLNSLGAHVDAAERIIVIEDTSELRLPGDHVVRLEGRPANSEGVGAVTIRQLLRNALRMRPDRLIVGEVRGGEALDLIFALNTGHDGSLATCHANSPSGALRRLRDLALLGGVNLPAEAIEAQLVEGVDIIVQVARCGARRSIVEVSEVGDEPMTVASLWKARSC